MMRLNNSAGLKRSPGLHSETDEALEELNRRFNGTAELPVKKKKTFKQHLNSVRPHLQSSLLRAKTTDKNAFQDNQNENLALMKKKSLKTA